MNSIDAHSFVERRVIPAVSEGLAHDVEFDEISRSWAGRGVVILSGRPRYLTNAYMNLRYLRENLGCRLPVEIWHLGPHERNDSMFDAFRSLGGIRFVDMSDVQRTFPMKPSTIKSITKGFAPASIHGWRSKSYCLLHSRFREVVLLDSDCFLFQRPESLFDGLQEYLRDGAVFSADIDTDPNTKRLVDPSTNIVTRLGIFSDKEWDYSRPNPLWAILGIPEDDLPEFDSGFMVVDKSRHVEATFLSFFLNDNSDLTYRYLYGDKDTFHLAWSFCRSPCSVIRDVSRGNNHIVARARGSILFEHRVFRSKFDVEKCWDCFPNNSDFHMREKFRRYFEDAKRHFSVKKF